MPLGACWITRPTGVGVQTRPRSGHDTCLPPLQTPGTSRTTLATVRQLAAYGRQRRSAANPPRTTTSFPRRASVRTAPRKATTDGIVLLSADQGPSSNCCALPIRPMHQSCFGGGILCPLLPRGQAAAPRSRLADEAGRHRGRASPCTSAGAVAPGALAVRPCRPCHYRATSSSPGWSPPDSRGQCASARDLGLHSAACGPRPSSCGFP